MIQRLCLYVFLIFALAGCSSGEKAPQGAVPAQGATKAAANSLASGAQSAVAQKGKPPTLNENSRELPKTYSATFSVQFSGMQNWVYELKTNKTPKQREMVLHIEGVEKARNPGDVRLVTDGTTTWMSGKGTDDECLQFPNNQGLNPNFILPENLVKLQTLSEMMKPLGEEKIAGRKTTHYTGKAPTLEQWREARVDVWLEQSSGALLQFEMQALGKDPYFNTGSGMMTALYTVTGLDAPNIAAITGCQLGISLPESATNLVKLPGLASFETPASGNEIIAFFLNELPKKNWSPDGQVSQSEKGTLMSFLKNGEEIQIQITARAEGGSKVKLLFIKQ